MRKVRDFLVILLCMMCIFVTGCNGCANNKPPVTSPIEYAINEVEIELVKNEKFTLEILANQEITAKVSWESENAEIAEVDVNGVVTGKKDGITRIFSRIDGKKFITIVRVVEKFNYQPQIILENKIELDGKYEITLIEGSSFEVAPALIVEDKVEGITFTLSSNSDKVAIDGLKITGVSVVDGAEVTISCEYQSKAYSIKAIVNVREV